LAIIPKIGIFTVLVLVGLISNIVASKSSWGILKLLGSGKGEGEMSRLHSLYNLIKGGETSGTSGDASQSFDRQAHSVSPVFSALNRDY
jgi:hypothetical protein